jgi:hypothetical protein
MEFHQLLISVDTIQISIWCIPEINRTKKSRQGFDMGRKSKCGMRFRPGWDEIKGSMTFSIGTQFLLNSIKPITLKKYSFPLPTSNIIEPDF